MTDSANAPISPRAFAALNAAVTVSALGFLFWLVYFHEPPAAGGSVKTLPGMSALFNAITASLLIAGRLAIRRGERRLHQHLMIAALVSSALFLVNYIFYHYTQGDTHFTGAGGVRPFYFFILISHIGLSTVVFPAILWALFLGLSDRIAQHRRIARWTWAGWIYVSITGIVIYAMLHVIDWS
jgi:putative membrane protein